MIKTFSLKSTPLLAHLNVLILEQAENIVKILEEILKRWKLGRRLRRIPRPETRGVDVDRRAFA
jgi:hypothetical protein